MKKLIVFLTLVSLTLVLLSGKSNAHEKHPHNEKTSCAAVDVTCAKTVTSAFAPDGTLWRLWSGEQQMFYSVSGDKGKHFGEPVKVDIKPEKISSRGENRPKLGFDSQNNVYLSWAKPLEKRFTAEVRFTYSTDGGKHFAPPMTIHNDGLEIGHSFNEMLVSAAGEVTLTWLDGRERKKQADYIGSALYSARGKLG
ncbi:MAG: exo-alpha-sialidase, partial [Psychrosphaera sp.]|nr:exo-alpha-sialidase [Psychrosphaera sp.]